MPVWPSKPSQMYAVPQPPGGCVVGPAVLTGGALVGGRVEEAGADVGARDEAGALVGGALVAARVDVGAAEVGTAGPLQATPLTEKSVGAGLLAEKVPWTPNSVDALAATSPL